MKRCTKRSRRFDGRTNSLAVLAALSATASAAGQCPLQWQPGDAVAGVAGTVAAALMWDPDGLGPSAPVMVVAGDFDQAGGSAAVDIAVLDSASATWSAFAAPLPSFAGPSAVRCLATSPNGDLIVGGSIEPPLTHSGSSGFVIAWNGSAWVDLAGGGYTDGAVQSLAVTAAGAVVAAGEFQLLDGAVCDGLGHWDGTAWSTFGFAGRAYSLLPLANGDLVVGGSFGLSTPAGLAVNVARWDGTDWWPLGGGLNDAVRCLAPAANGDVLAAGDFGTGAFGRVARWDGLGWSILGYGFNANGVMAALCELPGGDVIVGGSFQSAGTAIVRNIARWSSGSWSTIGPGVDGIDGPLHCLLPLAGPVFVVGGAMASSSPEPLLGVAVWDASAFRPMSTGLAAPVRKLRSLPGGGTAALSGRQVVSRSATGWTTAADFGAVATDLAVLANGDFVVCGLFTSVAGVAADGIARWNGTSWAGLGAGLQGTPACLGVAANGDVIVGGNLTAAGGGAVANIARWDGSAWSPLGSGVSGTVTALRALPNGDLLVGGAFATAGGQPAPHVARWDGSSWHAL
ncbi:MAG: hypothetical protein WAT39_00260, partial [Planctomycetota bacterium]